MIFWKLRKLPFKRCDSIHNFIGALICHFMLCSFGISTEASAPAVLSFFVVNHYWNCFRWQQIDAVISGTADSIPVSSQIPTNYAACCINNILVCWHSFFLLPGWRGVCCDCPPTKGTPLRTSTTITMATTGSPSALATRAERRGRAMGSKVITLGPVDIPYVSPRWAPAPTTRPRPSLWQQRIW